MKRVFHITILLVTVVAVFVSCSDKPDDTIENLKVAIAGETNTNATYLLYSAKAAEEGYWNINNMFYAAAAAENVHLKNHKDVLKKMGEPDFNPTAVTSPVNSTADNLQVTIDGEKNEYTETYPGFIATAKKGKFEDALRSFTLANLAEENHEKRFSDVLSILKENGSDETVPPVWFVCPLCGGMFTNFFSKCGLCFADSEKQFFDPLRFVAKP